MSPAFPSHTASRMIRPMAKRPRWLGSTLLHVIHHVSSAWKRRLGRWRLHRRHIFLLHLWSMTLLVSVNTRRWQLILITLRDVVASAARNKLTSTPDFHPFYSRRIVETDVKTSTCFFPNVSVNIKWCRRVCKTLMLRDVNSSTANWQLTVDLKRCSFIVRDGKCLSKVYANMVLSKDRVLTRIYKNDSCNATTSHLSVFMQFLTNHYQGCCN